MFFGSNLDRQQHDKQRELKTAGEMLNATIDKEFRENYLSMQREAIEGGIQPEKVDEFLQSFKRDTQLWAINRFKEILQQKLSQSAGRSSTVETIQNSRLQRTHYKLSGLTLNLNK